MLLLESTIHKKIVDPFGSTEIFRRETPDSDEKFLKSDHGIELPGFSSHTHSMSYSSSFDGNGGNITIDGDHKFEDDDEALLKKWTDRDTDDTSSDGDDEEEFF